MLTDGSTVGECVPDYTPQTAVTLDWDTMSELDHRKAGKVIDPAAINRRTIHESVNKSFKHYLLVVYVYPGGYCL
jgi:hypothetical protein